MRVTCKMNKEVKYCFKVYTVYIAEIKRKLGLPLYDVFYVVEELKKYQGNIRCHRKLKLLWMQ